MTCASPRRAACRRSPAVAQRRLISNDLGGQRPRRASRARGTQTTDRAQRPRSRSSRAACPRRAIRQAQAQQGQVLEQVVGTERAVVQAARAAFADLRGRAEGDPGEDRRGPGQRARARRRPRRAERRHPHRHRSPQRRAGTAQLAGRAVTAKRDAYVAGFQLLNAMGQAEAQDLGLDGGPLYDPLGNYRRVAATGTTGRAIRAIRPSRPAPSARGAAADPRRRSIRAIDVAATCLTAAAGDAPRLDSPNR